MKPTRMFFWLAPIVWLVGIVAFEPLDMFGFHLLTTMLFMALLNLYLKMMEIGE